MLASMLTAAVLAQAPALQLEWSAPAVCPQRDAVLASVWRRLGRLEHPQPLAADVTIVEQPDGFHLTIETQGGARRDLSGPSCTELSEAGALILALLVDPMLLSRPPPPPAEPVSPAPPPGRFSALLGVAGVADWGALPSIAAGWHASLLFDAGAFHLEAFGGTFAPQHLTNATLALEFDAGVRPCWSILSGRARPLLCGAVALGRTLGQGSSSITNPSGGTSLYAAAFLGAGVELELFWRLGLLLHLDGGMPLSRTFYEQSPGGVVYATRLFLARGELALVARLW